MFALRQSAGEMPVIHQPIFCNKKSVDGSQAFRLQKRKTGAKDRTRRRIAGVSPACGCTQPPMSDV
ncbi:MAG: hypothetical protein LBP59_13220 [Planctomycetaceae bacterium]|nr:hypothetical protein [Planctomycetaceae bacterium]